MPVMQSPSRHSPDEIDAAFERLVEQALDALQARQRAFNQTISSYARWRIDDDRALVLTHDTLAPLSFALTPIGTWLPSARQWAWAWANDAFAQEARDASARLKRLRERTAYAIFDCPHFDADAGDVDRLCALAIDELGALAMFRVADQEPRCYYAVHAPR